MPRVNTVIIVNNVTGRTQRSLSNMSVTSDPLCDVIMTSRNVKTSSGTKYLRAVWGSGVAFVINRSWVQFPSGQSCITTLAKFFTPM